MNHLGILLGGSVCYDELLRNFFGREGTLQLISLIVFRGVGTILTNYCGIY